MKADLEWVEKLEDGRKRKIRITFSGKSSLKWQFKCSDQEVWDYTSAPTPEDWATLEEKLEALYNRRRLPLKKLEIVRRLRKEALS